MTIAVGTRLGRYEIRSQLGAGGMGEVYRARDTELGRDVAVKVLPSSFSADRDRLQRFQQEACAASALNHPIILIVHDIGAHNGSPYVVSELLEGETLRKRIGGTALGQRRAIEYVSAKETGHMHPHFLPDGRHFLYLARSALLENSWIRVGSLDSKGTKRLMNSNANAAYAPPGYLLSMRGLTLMAQSFHPDKHELTGEPFVVAEQVDRLPGVNFGLFSVSQTGVLIYRTGKGANMELAWFDRGGKQLGTVGLPGAYYNPSLSPGPRVLVVSTLEDAVARPTTVVMNWISDLKR